MKKDTDGYLSMSAAQEVLGVSHGTLLRYVKSGLLTAYKRGYQRGAHFVLRDEVISLLQEIVPVDRSDQVEE